METRLRRGGGGRHQKWYSDVVLKVFLLFLFVAFGFLGSECDCECSAPCWMGWEKRNLKKWAEIWASVCGWMSLSHPVHQNLIKWTLSCFLTMFHRSGKTPLWFFSVRRPNSSQDHRQGVDVENQRSVCFHKDRWITWATEVTPEQLWPQHHGALWRVNQHITPDADIWQTSTYICLLCSWGVRIFQFSG